MFNWRDSLFESSRFQENLANSIAGQSCNIRFAKANGRDYIFIVSANELDKSKILKELVAYLADDFLLEYSNCEIITVHFNQYGNHQYRRFGIEWTQQGAELGRPATGRYIASKAEFLDSLFLSSISVDDFEEEQ